ncbi:MAG: ATP-binding protein [Elusimicrobia bacterium]|nr:ATP-binding protein [Elusimicrobiota bacterium]
MGSKSPLYGRRTSQLLLKPLRFADALPHLGHARQAVEAYAVFGGTPAYLMEYDRRKDLWSNIRKKILSPERSLFRDAEFVLRQEVREPRSYFSILGSIAKGNTRIGHIINDTGLNKGVVAKYLGVLIDLHFRLEKLGRWWDKDSERDLIGMGGKENLFCEVKWSDGVDTSEVVHKLQQSAAVTGLSGKPHFCLIHPPARLPARQNVRRTRGRAQYSYNTIIGWRSY